MYESPIRLLVQELETSIREQQDKQIFEVIQKYGVDVDRNELIKALAYDRDQYDKGYSEGRADAQRWISVEERLPGDDCDWVLAIGKFVPENIYGKPIISELRKDGKWWGDISDEFPLEDMGIRITHWMPLPPMPEEVCP